jgi:hypothetical protein
MNSLYDYYTEVCSNIATIYFLLLGLHTEIPISSLRREALFCKRKAMARVMSLQFIPKLH